LLRHLERGWIGTDDGLDLMNSNDDNGDYSFSHFRNDPANNHSIAQNNVLKIFFDQKGNMWLTSKQGMLDMLPTASIQSGQFHFRHFLNQINEQLWQTLNQ
jgi:ligand-binding sensor domain-containing protein